MALKNYISSDYINAANKLKGKKARRRIVAYVESYDDVFFWRMVLSRFEDDTRYFEVMLPSRNSLNKGKKQALMSLMKNGAGNSMMACVDADYDYLINGRTFQSDFMLGNPYVVHTYVYAIENYQCYAQSLHNVCVMATLNDHSIFDFETFLQEYSKAIYPLFIWSIMLYRQREYTRFSITDFNKVVTIRHSRLPDMMSSIEKVRHKVRVRISELIKAYPGRKAEYLKTKDELVRFGVMPENTYLFVQGHHLFENVVAPTVQTVCDELRREREREIRGKAMHVMQLQNELSAYTKSQSDITAMLKKNMGYTSSPFYQRILKDVERIINRQEKEQQ